MSEETAGASRQYFIWMYAEKTGPGKAKPICFKIEGDDTCYSALGGQTVDIPSEGVEEGVADCGEESLLKWPICWG